MTRDAEWIGRVGQAWAAEWRRTDRAFAPLTQHLLAALDRLAPTSGRALDIGCGAGETAIALAGMRPGLAVVGADLSEELVSTARTRAAGAPNLSFVLGNAAARCADAAPIDLFLSRHGVMFFDDPGAAFTAFHAAAAPGAPLVFSCFRDWSLNGFASEIETALGIDRPAATQPGPFAFADESRVRLMLEAAGWRSARADAVDFAYVVGDGEDPVADAVSFLTHIGPGARAINAASVDERPLLVERLRQCCVARHAGGTVAFPAAAWLWTAIA